MDVSALLVEAASLLVVGMLVVFTFLGLMVVCVQLMSNLVGKDPVPPVSSGNVSRQPGTPAKADGVPPQVVAAISGAVHQYRRQHRSQENK